MAIAAPITEGPPAAAPGSRLVHAVPGRLRYHVPRVAADAGYAEQLAVVSEASPDVLSVRVNRAAGSVVVRYVRSASDLAIRDAVERHVAAAVHAGPHPAPSAARRAARDQPRWRAIALPALTAGLALLGGPLALPVPAPLMAAAVGATALPIARRAWHSLRVERRLNIDVLDMTAISLTTLRGSFLAPAAMISLVEIGEAIRERTARASEREVHDLLASLSQLVWVRRGGERRQVPSESLRRGDTILVYPGDRIPADGHVLEGTALIDEHHLTGESMPKQREEGHIVYASTLVREGHLHIRVEHTGDETRAGRIIRLVQDAPVHDTRIENYAATVADRAVAPAFLLAGAVLVLTRNPGRAASILITDFMTGVRVSVPTTVLAGMTAAARSGILIRSGRALEQLADVDTVVFDKTGTVTHGEPTVVGVESVDERTSPGDVLEFAATAEQRLRHPVARAVMRYAHDHGARPGRRGDWHYDIGLGVRAEIDGETILVGGERLLEREGIDLVPAARARSSPGASRIFVARGGRLRGVLTYADPPREESREVIAVLRERHGMEIHLLTGDNRDAARAVADRIGIDPAHTHAELFPDQKAEVVRRLRRRGRRVAFVGDGVNDLPALAYADVAISFGGATDVARETADVVLMDDDLEGFPRAVAASRQAMRLIHQNIAIVVGTNLAALGLATAGGLGPVSAAVIHNGSTVLAGANGLRPLVQRDAAGAPPSESPRRRRDDG